MLKIVIVKKFRVSTVSPICTERKQPKLQRLNSQGIANTTSQNWLIGADNFHKSMKKNSNHKTKSGSFSMKIASPQYDEEATNG